MIVTPVILPLTPLPRCDKCGQVIQPEMNDGVVIAISFLVLLAATVLGALFPDWVPLAYNDPVVGGVFAAVGTMLTVLTLGSVCIILAAVFKR